MQMHKKRVIQVGLVCLLLAVTFSVGGCFSSPSTIEAEINTVLNRLEYAMLKEDIDLILWCYTNPFYVNKEGLELPYTHEGYRSWLTEFFRTVDYKLYELRDRVPYKVSSNEVRVLCNVYVAGYDGDREFHDFSDAEYILVKRLGRWKIEKIFDRTVASGSRTLSVLGLPQE